MPLESAEAAIRRHAMISEGGRVLVAVSGGIDSVVLLDVLTRLSTQETYEIVVGHIDHGWRGEASREDAEFVETLAKQHDVPYRCHRLSQSEAQRERSQGREGAARHARLAALRAMASDVKADRIALGHTADDQAETILFRLVRGTGPKGLAGMSPVRLPFVRPLLTVGRPDILAYAKERGLTWREDVTNIDPSYARNRLRQHVLPELRAINPAVVDALCRAADLQSDLDDATDFFVRAFLSDVRVDKDRPDSALRRSCLQALPEPVDGLILRDAIRQVRGDLAGIKRVHIDAVQALMAGEQAHGALSLPGIEVRVEGDRLSFVTGRGDAPSSWSMDADLGITQLPGGDRELELRIVQPTEVDLDAVAGDRWFEAADADRIQFPLHLRTRQPGDRFMPLGMSHEIKLKDFLINEHAPYYDRGNIPLLCDERSILWVVGLRLSDTVRLSDETQRILLMQVREP